jgi:hypothetical protein
VWKVFPLLNEPSISDSSRAKTIQTIEKAGESHEKDGVCGEMD